MCCDTRHGTSLLAERIRSLNAALQDSEAETSGALKRGMLAMNRAMMKPDHAAAAGDDYKDGNDSETELASTDEVMVDLVQRNIAVMEGKYGSGNGESGSNHTAAASSSGDSAAAPASSDQSTASTAPALPVPAPTATPTSTGKKKKASSGGRDIRREQSLGHLSAVFVQMFLANDTRVVSLEEAARWLLRSNLTPNASADSDEQMTPFTRHDAFSAATDPSVPPLPSPPAAGRVKDKSASLFKSKVRRLYDIANVLSSLRLIDKIQLIQSRRPAFRWLGADVYPLQSSISEDQYTREGSGKVKQDGAPASKKRSSSIKQQQQQQQPHPNQNDAASAVRVKREKDGSTESGSADAGGGQSQTLHSAFSSPGSLAAVRTQPLSFSFTKVPPAVITPSGPSLSQQPASSHIPASAVSASSDASPAVLAAPALPSTSSSPVSSSPASTSLPSSPSSSSRAGGVYWIVHHDRSFSMDVRKMAEFDPLEFAYLPYICPPGLHSILNTNTAALSTNTNTNTNTNTDNRTQSATAEDNAAPGTAATAAADAARTAERLPLPGHVAALSPSVQAAYVRDTPGFVSAFSAACKRWVQLIPDMAAQAHRPHADKHTNGSAKAAPAAADSAAASGHSNNSHHAASSTSIRPRRSNTRSGGGSSSSKAEMG